MDLQLPPETSTSSVEPTWMNPHSHLPPYSVPVIETTWIAMPTILAIPSYPLLKPTSWHFTNRVGWNHPVGPPTKVVQKPDASSLMPPFYVPYQDFGLGPNARTPLPNPGNVDSDPVIEPPVVWGDSERR